ncbi:MAG: LysR substrate-binding domain-containing protein [Cyanobacteria bacterium J06598_3]
MDLLRLSTLEIRQICYFLMVVECENSFSRAAERLHIEQPPLSQRIRALEKRLKVELFNRRRRPVQLTAAGQVFLDSVRPAIAQIEQAIAQAQRAEKGEIGHLSIGIASSAANGVLPDLLRRFRDRHPHVTLEMRELTVEQQLQLLEQKQLDIGLEVISPLRLENKGFEWRVIDKESLVVVLPEAHPLAKAPTVALTALAPETLILPSLQAFSFYQSFLEQCTLAGFVPHLLERTTATWMLTILSLVAAGVGLAILPSNVQTLQRQGVVYREISGLNLTRQLLAVWRQDNRSATLQRWLAVVEDHQQAVS